jgi:hypothetical protein
MDLETFAAERSDRLTSLADLLKPAIEFDLGASEPAESLADTLIAGYHIAYEELFGTEPSNATLVSFMADMSDALDRLEVSDNLDAQRDRLALWFATAMLGHATFSQAPASATKTWVTMRDEAVRDIHADLNGTTIDILDTFVVASVPPAVMEYPGQPVGPPEAWINCRCVLSVSTNVVAAAEPYEAPAIEEIDDEEPPEPDELISAEDEDMPVHGVLAPLGVESGDGRSFSELTTRELPLPLKWQRAGLPDHQGDIVVGRIDNIFQEADLMMWDGVLIEDVPETEEVLMLIAQQALRGVSVEADMATATSVTEPEDMMDSGSVEFAARATGATIVATPAFPEANIKLGPAPWLNKEEDAEESEEPVAEEPVGDEVAAGATVLHFKRGSGWVTHPEETNRLHKYWTKGKGAAKIRWGSGGDFTRCTRQLKKYITPTFLNRTCAEWHHDALGYWPGELGKPGNNPKNSVTEIAMDTAPALTLTAAAPPSHFTPDWFENPGLQSPTPFTVTDDGRVFGHLATFGQCHIGVTSECVIAPHSVTNYAHFHTGTVMTSDGQKLAAGRVTFNTGHADLNASVNETVSHYDHTGSIAAMVRAGEDAHGIWVAGGLCDIDPSDIRTLQASAGLSGDWRTIGGNLELVAALAVNVPGFPIPRTALAASGADVDSLVAANQVVKKMDTADAIAASVLAALDRRESRKVALARVKAAQETFRAERAKTLVANLAEV